MTAEQQKALAIELCKITVYSLEAIEWFLTRVPDAELATKIVIEAGDKGLNLGAVWEAIKLLKK